MSAAAAQELTLADVLQQLGGISPRRIRFRPGQEPPLRKMWSRSVIVSAAYSSWSTVFWWRRSWVYSEYLASGCRLVWLVDPRTRTVAVYTSHAKPIVITEKQTLIGGDVLPGFRLPLRKLFELLDEME